MVDARVLAEEAERWLGDPELPANTVSFARALELDEREELPADGVRRLRAFGFHRYFVPAAHGGALRSCEELLWLSRVVARRNMSVAVSESTQLWMMLVWIGGDAAQRARALPPLLRGEVVPCLAYSEPGHGADLAANEFLALPEGGEYVMNGSKWPINRGASSTHVVLLGATRADAAPDDVSARRRQSLFLVEKAAVASGRVEGMPRVPTYGLRGCDISGVSFEEARVPASARLGAEGEGLELALRGLLVTRTFCTGLSLGAGDTMLRTVGGFLSRRVLYEGPASRIPYVAESLANAYLSLLVAECVSLVAMRGLHLYTEEFSIWANLAKVEVARLVDHNGKVLARTLGARYYMREAEHQGVFQKMLRDAAIVSVFDGSEPVCLDSVALQLSSMVKARRRPREEDWSALYDLRAALPEFEPARVAVFGRGRDATFASLPALCERLAALAPSPGCGEERLAALRSLAERLRADVEALFTRVAEARRRPAGRAPHPAAAPGETAATATAAPAAAAPATATATAAAATTKTTSTRLIRLAEECCALHAKVAALGIWLYNRDHLDAFFAEGGWLQAALAREQVHTYELGELDEEIAARLCARLQAQHEAGEFFSLRPVRQAAPGAREESGIRQGPPGGPHLP
ncbi:peptide synthetase [Streptomyces hoynatensis]|uniref:Peptide synthetase n=1 Tax=Streptomyces hoynatensis TaxID=1141874 RepID=A0A3A9YWW0_9ACTN|nr:peptide synthetase [Streptomyces hoynatensis]